MRYVVRFAIHGQKTRSFTLDVVGLSGKALIDEIAKRAEGFWPDLADLTYFAIIDPKKGDKPYVRVLGAKGRMAIVPRRQLRAMRSDCVKMIAVIDEQLAVGRKRK